MSHISPKLRHKIFKRDGFTCVYCGRKAGNGVVLQVDHKTPSVDGGSDDEGNLCTSCDECNIGKGPGRRGSRDKRQQHAPQKPSGLVGRWFHAVRDRRIYWQGKVTAEVAPGEYLVQTYEWASGSPWDEHLVNINEMREWKFYDSAAEAVDYYQNCYSDPDRDNGALNLGIESASDFMARVGCETQ